jgi:peptidoglycan/LPS O-acetylase OafA/YrhL
MTTTESQVVDAGLPDPAARHMRARIIGLDGARGLACLCVVITHVSGHFSPLTTAATKLNLLGFSLVFFYVLSGFLLFLPYVRALTETHSSAKLPNTKNFAIHRVARVFPGFLVIFLLCNYVFQVAYVQSAALARVGTDEGTGMITNPWQLLANLTLVQTYFPRYLQTGLNPSWSLTLELAFYVSLPLLGMLLFALRKRTSVRPLTLAVLAPIILIVIGVIGRLLAPLLIAHFHVSGTLLQNWGPNWVAVYLRSFLTSADNFGFGMLAAIAIVAMEQQSVSERLSRRVRRYSGLALLPAVMVSLALMAVHSLFGTTAIAVGAGLVLLIIVAPLARGEKSAIASFLDGTAFRYVGKVSLSIYLWHFPVMLLLGRCGLMAGDSVAGVTRNVVLTLAVTLSAATITYYAVEEPAMKLARRYRYQKTDAASGAVHAEVTPAPLGQA